jgi:hypothetical protein
MPVCQETLRVLVLVLLAVTAAGQNTDRYAELWRVIDRNSGFAHAAVVQA